MSEYDFMNEKEVSFLKHSEDYLRAVQERVAAFFIAIEYSDVQKKVNSVSNLWYKIVIDEANSFYKLLYQKSYKNDDDSFMKRKGYRTKNQFAFDLITNWAFERTVVPYLHEYSGLEFEKFEMNPETCDADARLGWDASVDDDKPRKINSKYDFISKIGDDIHNIELKSMFVPQKRSANFKVFFTPDKKSDLNKYHVLFFNFDGLGNPKGIASSKSNFELFYIPWAKLIQCHIHYPPQLDKKPCYLVHFDSSGLCELYDEKGQKNSVKINNSDDCFVIGEPVLQKELRYDNVKPYLNYNDDKFHPENILEIVKQN